MPAVTAAWRGEPCQCQLTYMHLCTAVQTGLLWVALQRTGPESIRTVHTRLHDHQRQLAKLVCIGSPARHLITTDTLKAMVLCRAFGAIMHIKASGP